MKEKKIHQSKAEKIKADLKKYVKKLLLAKEKVKSDANSNVNDKKEKVKSGVKKEKVDNLETFTVNELKEILCNNKQPLAGTKSELIKRIRNDANIVIISNISNIINEDNQNDLEKLKIPELKDILRKYNLLLSGTKSDMIERIINRSKAIELDNDDDGLEKLTSPDLKDILRKYGLLQNGKRGELIQRIRYCIPFSPYIPPSTSDDINYADDHGCGTNGAKFSLKLAPTGTAMCRRCLIKIEQGRLKISYPHLEEIGSWCGSRLLEAEKSYHVECFACNPPRGIAEYSDINFNPYHSEEEHRSYVREQFGLYPHDPALKNTPRHGGSLQAFRVQQRLDGKQINGRDAVIQSLNFFDE